MNSIYKKPTSIALGAMLIFVCILFKPVIFGGKTFGSPDSLSPQAVGIALNEIQKETGNYPLWQPWVFSGMPAAEAFTNLSKLYFPEYLFKLFFLPGMLIQLAHLIFAGLGCFFLLKHFKCSPWSSFLGAIGYMLTPYMVTMVVFGHGSQMMTAAYLPWVMWLTIRLWEKPTVPDAGWLAIILGFQLQRAHAQIAYYTWMLMGAYVLLQLILKLKVIKSRGSVLKSCGLFTAAIFVGIGIALLVYLPSLEYTPFSVRGGGTGGGADYSYATGWSFHPKEILTFLIPSAFGFGGQTYWGFMPFTDYPNYMGVIILSLAILGLFHRRDSFSWFLAGTSVLALFISFGKYFSPIYDLFFNLLPFFNKFRVPHMILILLQFNIAMLAAFGLDGIMSLKEKKVPQWFWGFAGLTVLGMVVLSLGGTGLESWLKTKFTIPRVQDVGSARIINSLRWDLWIADAWLAIGFLGGLIIFIWLRIQRKIGKELLAIAVVAMAVVDIGIVDHKIISPGRKSGRGSQLISKRAVDRFFEKDEIIHFLQSDSSRFRIYPAGMLFGESRFAAFGLESVGGYHPAKLKSYNDFLKGTRNAGSLPVLRMLNVKYLLTPQRIDHPDLVPVKSGNLKTGRGDVPVEVYKLNNALPRAWFVEEVKSLSSPDLIWQSISNPAYDPEKTVFITQAFTRQNQLSPGSVRKIDTDLHRVLVETESDKSGFLVLSEVHYPLRWKAFIDGKPVATIPTNGILRGVEVPAGDHKVEFIYDRSSFDLGVTLSLVSFGLALMVVVGGHLQGRRKK